MPSASAFVCWAISNPILINDCNPKNSAECGHVSNGSDNGLSPVGRQAITWTIADMVIIRIISVDQAWFTFFSETYWIWHNSNKGRTEIKVWTMINNDALQSQVDCECGSGYFGGKSTILCWNSTVLSLEIQITYWCLTLHRCNMGSMWLLPVTSILYINVWTKPFADYISKFIFLKEN